MEKQFFTVEEVHKLTGLHPNTIRKRAKDGVFRTIKRVKGAPYLIDKESLYDRGN